MTNIIHIIACIAALEQGPNPKANEYSVYNLTPAAIADVARDTGLDITVAEVDGSPIAASFTAQAFVRMLERRLKRRLHREPTVAEIGSAYNVGYRGALLGRGMGYGQRLRNLMEAK